MDDATCYSYDPLADVWVNWTKMSADREFAAGVNIDFNNWWVSGGYGSGEISSEIYHAENKSFTSFVDLPERKFLHHIVKLNDNEYMLLTGDDSTNVTWIFR